MEKIKTPKGIYRFSFKVLYLGKKRIDKKISKQNLSDFNAIATKNNLKFGLLYGTLLGAIREQDFITHDEDIDLFILSEQQDLFLSMLFELRDEGFEVVRYDRRGLISIMRNNEYIDIYIFRPFREGIRTCCGECVLEKYLLDTMYIDFLSEQILVPNDYEEYLVFEYGKDWKTPVYYTDFNIGKLSQLLFFLKEKVKYKLPDFIFYPYVKKLEQKFIDDFYRKLERFEAYNK